MLALLASLREQAWAQQACAELPAELSAPLLRSLSGAPGSSTDAGAVIDSLWERVEDGRGWTEPCLREAYCLAQVAAAVAAASPEAALRHLDMAFIMGGPAEVLQPFVLLVEPRVVRGSTPLSASPHATVTPLVTQRPVTVLQHPTRSEFKAFFDTDTPVVVRGVTDSWRAPVLWADLGWWAATHGHRHIPLEVGAFNSPDWHEEVTSVADFCTRLAAGKEVVYCAQHTLFDHLCSLQQDFSVPDIIRGKVTRTNAWVRSPIQLGHSSASLTRHPSADGLCGHGHSAPRGLLRRPALPNRGLQTRHALRRCAVALPLPFQHPMGRAATLADSRQRGGGCAAVCRGGEGHHFAGGCGGT